MKFYPLTNPEVTGYLANYACEITYEDLTETTAATAQALKLIDDAAIGTIIGFAGLRLVEPFEDASDAAFNSTTVQIGVTGATNNILAATQVNKNGTEVLATGVGAATQPYGVVAASIDLLVTFNSMTAKALNDLDKGKLLILLQVSDLGNFKAQSW